MHESTECWATTVQMIIAGERNIVTAISKLGTFFGCPPDPEEIKKRGFCADPGMAPTRSGGKIAVLVMSSWDFQGRWGKALELLALLSPEIHDGAHFAFRSLYDDWSVLVHRHQLIEERCILVDPLEANLCVWIGDLINSETRWLRHITTTDTHIPLRNKWLQSMELVGEYLKTAHGKGGHILERARAGLLELATDMTCHACLESDDQPDRFTAEELGYRPQPYPENERKE